MLDQLPPLQRLPTEKTDAEKAAQHQHPAALVQTISFILLVQVTSIISRSRLYPHGSSCL